MAEIVGYHEKTSFRKWDVPILALAFTIPASHNTLIIRKDSADVPRITR
jgi:hypothetical protein